MRRDLVVCQQERIQREEAAEAARQNKAREEAIPRTNTTASIHNESKRKHEETTSAENPSKRAKIEAIAEPKTEAPDVETEKEPSGTKTTGLSLPTTTPNATSNPESTQPAADPSKDDSQQTKATDSFPEPTPTSAGIKDFDFDSMFPDSTGGDNNDINPGSNANNNDFDFSSALSASNNNDAGQASMDSILPGLESYANSGGDTAGIGDFNVSDAPTTGAEADATQDSAIAGGDSTFDDLFSYAAFEMGQGNGQSDDNNGMADTDFDDLFLNTD